MSLFPIAILILLGIIFTARMITERANKWLSDEQKVQLVDLFSKDRKQYSILMLGLLVAYLLLYYLNWIDFLLLSSLFGALFYIILIVTVTSGIKKLKANDFPPSYIKAIQRANLVRIVGFALFFLAAILIDIN